MKTIRINSCNYYHQTNLWSAKSILQNGFYVDSGGNQRYTEGIYLLNHPEGGYGDVTLQVCVYGYFLDFTDDVLANRWVQFKDKYWKGNYTRLTEDIRKDFPRADGIAFNSMLVVWKPDKINKIKLYR